MGAFTGALVVIAALLADLGVEISAEISADTLLDGDAGAVIEMRPEAPDAIVDMSPIASLYWPR
jgi:hypothetical protein